MQVLLFAAVAAVVLGLVALALTLAVLGYFAADLGWRAYVAASWRRRARRRAA